jgi:hypothetical protein
VLAHLVAELAAVAREPVAAVLDRADQRTSGPATVSESRA